jgi:hypothetical protein
MNRKQKIKLLQDVMQGKKKIRDISPFISVKLRRLILGKGGKVIRIDEKNVLIERELYEKP